MVTAPLFFVLLVAAFVAVKYANVKPGVLILGVLLGLSLASTAVGPTVLTWLQDGMTAVISSATRVTGAA
jgi:hypothetical protein